MGSEWGAHRTCFVPQLEKEDFFEIQDNFYNNIKRKRSSLSDVVVVRQASVPSQCMTQATTRILILFYSLPTADQCHHWLVVFLDSDRSAQ